MRALRKLYEDQMRNAQEEWLRKHQAKVEDEQQHEEEEQKKKQKL